MSDKEAYNQRMENYFRQCELNIEDAQLALKHEAEAIAILKRKQKCGEDYLQLAIKELERSKEVLRKYNEENNES